MSKQTKNCRKLPDRRNLTMNNPCLSTTYVLFANRQVSGNYRIDEIHCQKKLPDLPEIALKTIENKAFKTKSNYQELPDKKKI